MDTAKYAALFLSDSREHLRQCDALLLAWERTPGGLEPVTGLFRALHTIKGMAATMGYERLAGLSHDAEHLLDAVRGGRVTPTPELVALMFDAIDAVAAGVEDAAAGADGRRLDPALSGRLAAYAAAGSPADPATTARPSVPAAAQPGEGDWVEVAVRPGVAMGWARALLALRRAEELGRVSAVTPDPARVSPDTFGGRLAFRLETARDAAEVTALLMEVGDIASVTVGGAAAAPAVEPVATRQELRVDRREIDRLVSEVGELVVSRNRLAELAERRRDPDLEAAAATLSRLVDAIHERVMRARMVPVAEVFDRFPRVVRDLARQLGKSAELEVAGREIELDRSVLDAIGDPLLHLLRNAVDHGLEPPAQRAAAGKPARGTVRLEARRDRDAVVITVSDDGGGVDRGRIEARLAAAGEPAALGDDAALLRVLARPGFSTAGAVTGVSGRGVGIDAVIARVRELGGEVTLRSRPGEGTSFSLRLPLTLAVVPVLLVTAGPERYGLPLGRVVETGRGTPEAGPGGLVVSLRGERLEARDLRVEVGAAGDPPGTVRPFLVVPVGEGRGALLVDTLLGRQDLVVVGVDLPAGARPWLTGAAILSDGRPAFLVDPGGLF